MKLGQKIVLHVDELTTHSNSLRSIFSIFDERMRSLEGMKLFGAIYNIRVFNFTFPNFSSKISASTSRRRRPV